MPTNEIAGISAAMAHAVSNVIFAVLGAAVLALVIWMWRAHKAAGE